MLPYAAKDDQLRGGGLCPVVTMSEDVTSLQSTTYTKCFAILSLSWPGLHENEWALNVDNSICNIFQKWSLVCTCSCREVL